MSIPFSRMGPPPRSFAADAHDCIMVRARPWTYRIQGCGAMIRARWQAPPLIINASVLRKAARLLLGFPRSGAACSDNVDARPARRGPKGGDHAPASLVRSKAMSTETA